MAEVTVQLFVSCLDALQAQVAGETPAPLPDDAPPQAAAYREDFLDVFGSEELAERWDEQNPATEETFSTLVHIAEAYLRTGDARRPYLRMLMRRTRDQSEEPQYLRAAAVLISMSPADRIDLLVHGGIVNEVIEADSEERWPVPRARIEEVAARLTDPELERGANFHVKYLREAGLVKVSARPHFQSELAGGPEDLWLFVKLTDDAPRLIWALGFE